MFVKKKRVLVLSDYRCATGFSTVTTNILRQVQKYYGNQLQFDIIAINWYGDPLPDDYVVKGNEAADIREVDEEIDGEIKKVKKRIVVRDENTTVYSAYYHDGKNDIFGRNAFLSYLKHIEYSLVFIVQDIGVVTGVLEVIRMIREDDKKLQRKRKKFKVIYYFPKDSDVILPGWFENLGVADKLVAYTHYAKEIAIRANKDLESLKIPVIYHGVNTAEFKKLPAEDVARFREAYFGKNHNKFIVSNINRNQFRKDIPSTILAFQRFYDREKTFPKPFLYLHMNPDDIQGWNLRTLLQQTRLVEYEDYMFTPPDLIKDPPEPGFINCLYNASDVYLTTTTGEGFGLTVLEAMMAQVPVIAPWHTSLREIGGGDSDERIFAVGSDGVIVSRFDSIIRPKVSIDDVVMRLEDICRYDKIGNRVKNAHEFARELSWNSVGKKWIEIFKSVL